MSGRGAGSTYVVSSDQPNLYKCIRQLKKEEHSLFNCLNSIYDDAAFVNEIAVLYPSLPVFANLRCGLWYLPNPKHTCYFKSTDGHTGNWSFSTTRLNWHVAELAAQRGGCIIVDATRKGKRFPVSMQHQDTPLHTQQQRQPTCSCLLCTTYCCQLPGSAKFACMPHTMCSPTPCCCCVTGCPQQNHPRVGRCHQQSHSPRPPA
jgi:hypothetical protein